MTPLLLNARVQARVQKISEIDDDSLNKWIAEKREPASTLKPATECFWNGLTESPLKSPLGYWRVTFNSDVNEFVWVPVDFKTKIVELLMDLNWAVLTIIKGKHKIPDYVRLSCEADSEYTTASIIGSGLERAVAEAWALKNGWPV